jgi:hyperosmotically inducible protein
MGNRQHFNRHGPPIATSALQRKGGGDKMKNLMVAGGVALAIFTLVQFGGASAAHTQGERERMENAVRRQLTPVVGVFDYVTFKIDADQTVTLFGQVREPRVKTHAEEDTKKVEGVGRVVNNIETLPLLPADDDLRLALYWAIYRQAGLNRYTLQIRPPIHIIVKNGHVTLEGVVANSGEYTQANVAANAVSGVFSVKNNLRVEASS